jgi:hypothetical protein
MGALTVAYRMEVSSVPPWLQLAGTLAAAVVGGILAPYVTNSRERRAARANLFVVILQVEERRWGDNTNYKDFRQSVFALQSTAVIGRVPRWAVDNYLHAATKARREGRAMGFDENGPVWVGDNEQEAVVRRPSTT